MPYNLVPIIARSPEGEVLHFSCRKEAAEKTGHPVPTISSACHRRTPTETGWSFKRATDPSPFLEPLITKGHHGRRGIPIEDDEGVVYPNSTIAALLLGVTRKTVLHRIQHGIYQKRMDLICQEESFIAP